MNGFISRFIEGRVCFTAEDGFTERFLERLQSAGAVLYNLKRNGAGVSASVNDADLDKVMDAASDSGMRIVCGKRTGLRTFYERYRNRIGIPIGMALGTILFAVLSSVLWSIQVTGLQQINKEQFGEYLSSNGINTGIFLVNVDCNEIERIIEKYDAGILRAEVNLSGTKLFIHVAERDMPPQSQGYAQYANLVAYKDGEVMKADILAGDQKVNVGDAVSKGDLLAAGAIHLKDGGVRYLQAQGHVIARTQTQFACMTSKQISAETLTKTKDLRSVYFFGVRFPPLSDGAIENKTMLSTTDSVFPVGIIRQRITQRTPERLILSSRQALLITLNDIADMIVSSFYETEIESVTLTPGADDQAELQVKIICLEDIAEIQVFEAVEQ